MAELDDLLGSLLGDDEKEKTGSGDVMDILLKVMPLLSTIDKESDDERLLKALMPYMNEERRNKLDTAQSILKIAKILPLLSEVFGGGEK